MKSRDQTIPEIQDDRDRDINQTERRELARHSSTGGDPRQYEEMERAVRYQQCGGGRRVIRKGPSHD